LSERRSRLLGAARVVYLVALAILLAWLVWTRWDDLAALLDQARPGWLAVALVFAIIQLLPNVGVWTLTLRHLGDPVRVRSVLSATARSVPARYVPGSVWYALGRASLLRSEAGLSKRSLAAAAGLESTLGVVVAIALGSGLFALAGRLPGQGWWLAIWFVLLGLAGSPPAVNAALNYIAERSGGGRTELSWGTWSQLVGITVLHWGWSAATFSIYLLAFPGLRTAGVFEIAGAYLLGWAVGFLAVFAPQGAGVFEAAVAAMLVDQGVATAAVVIAGFRALMLVRDVTVFSAATLLRGRRREGVEAARGDEDPCAGCPNNDDGGCSLETDGS
jgi:glycosyltransferase 2 family protein